MNYRHIVILLLAICAAWNTGYSQPSVIPSFEIDNWIDSQFTSGMDSLNMAGATFVLVQGDSIVYSNGYGLADIENNIPVTDSTTLFGIASISKTFVGVAIMQLYEDGKLDLDEDINQYLKSFKVEYKYANPITIKHLLTHTAGLDERNIGNRVRTEDEVISLADYLQKRLPPQIRPPGEALTYSNHGYALLGLIVEDIAGLRFHEYVKKNILKPLEMNSSGFKKQVAYRANYSLSYLQKDDSLITYEPSFILPYPSGGMTSTAKDMSHYISALLNYGNYDGKQLLDSLTISKMFSPAFKHYEMATDGWLLGFYEEHWKGIQIVQHAGDIDGFANILLLIPEKNIGLFISINSSNIKDRKSRGFIQEFTDHLLDKILPAYALKKMDIRPPDFGTVRKPLKSFTGNYRQTRYALTTLDKVAVFIGLTPEVNIVLKNDTLELQEENEQLIPVSDLTFFRTIEKKPVAFGENDKGDIQYFFDDNTSYHRLKWYETVKFQIILISSIVLIYVIFVLGSLARRLFYPDTRIYLVGKINISIAILSLTFLISFGTILLTTDPYEFVYGIPDSLKFVLILPFVIIALVILSLYFLFSAIRRNKVDFWILNFAVTIASLFFIAWLFHWNLIGFNY